MLSSLHFYHVIKSQGIKHYIPSMASNRCKLWDIIMKLKGYSRRLFQTNPIYLCNHFLNKTPCS